MADDRDILYTLDIDVANAASALDLILFRLKKIETDGVATIKALDKAFSGLNKTMNRTLKADRKAQVNEQKKLTTSVKATTAAQKENASIAAFAAGIEERRARLAVAAAAKERQAAADSKKRKLDFAKATKAQAREAKLLEREQLRLIRSNKELRRRMQEIVATSGVVKVKLGGQKAEMGSVERQIQDLVEEYDDLNTAMKQTRDSAVFKRTGKNLTTRLSPANLTGSTGSTGGITPFEVRQLAQELDRLGLAGANTAGTLGSIFGPAGVAAAVFALGIIQLTKLFVKLGKAGVKAMSDLIKAAVETGKEYELVTKAAQGFFMGNEEAAKGALKFVEELGEAYGVAGAEILKRFAPLAKSTEQLREFAEAAQFLKFLDPSQSMEDIVRVLTDASRSGNLIPLKRTFSAPIDGIKAMQEELGLTAGLLAGLKELAVDYGFSLEDILETGAIATERLNQQWETFLQKMGTPISVQLGESISEVIGGIEGAETEIDTIFATAGEGVANIIETLTEFVTRLGDVDSEGFLEIATSVRIIFEGLDEIVKMLGRMHIPDDVSSGFNTISDVVTRVTGKVLKLIGVMDALFQFASKLVNIQSVAAGLLGGPAGFVGSNAITGDLKSALGELKDDLSIVSESFNAYEEGAAGAADATNRLHESLQETGDLDAANSILDYKNALEEVGRLEPQIEEMNDKIADTVQSGADDIAEAELQLTQKVEDAALDRQRKLLDLEEETAEKRVDAARKNADKIEDIFRKHQQSITDAATGLRDKEADIALKFSRKQEDIESESAKNKIKIEEDYRNKLEEIRRKFFFNMEEAIRNNDAVAFLRLQRQLEFELESQKETRDTKLEEDSKAAEEKRAKAALELEREVQDAAIANERKLRDLQTNLARQLEAQSIAYARELEAIAVAEERKREEINKSFERQIEDINTWYDRRVEAINAGTEKEIAAIRAANEKIIAAYDEATARLAAANQRRMAAMSTRGSLTGNRRGRRSAESFDESLDPLVSLTGDTRPGRTPTDFTNAPPQLRRQFGGPVRKERAYLVGESGPELFAPNINGKIIPNSQLMFSPPVGAFGGTTNNFSKRLDANVNMLDPSNLSKAQIAKIESVVSAVLMEALR